mmetsp:Transcript_177959/g.564768  ORF Transcript_177959/g.564768 Transcript_177959/m.564768 type:complete len:1067 (+) Transcript_177959:56-3256(+)
MAQKVVAAALRRAVLPHFHVPDLEAQVNRGQLVLSDAQLREPVVLFGLCCTGSIETLSATWSWRSLLSSPATLEVCGLYVCIRLGDGGASSPSVVGADDEGPDPQSRSFVNRLKRRIWETLRLKITKIHIRLEAPGDEDSKSAAVVGIVLDSLAVESDGSRQGQAGLRQTVRIENAGIYATFEDNLPSLSAAAVPPYINYASFIMEGLSPHCRAVRTSGRRFVDMRGLALQIDLGEPAVSCTREQYWCIKQVASALGRLGTARPEPPAKSMPAPTAGEAPADRMPSDEAKDPALPCRGQSQPSLRSRLLAGRPGWVSCGRKSKDQAFEPQVAALASEVAAERFLECISAEDQTRLLAEEAPPSGAAAFDLAVTLGQASLTAVDFLHGTLRGSFSATCREDGWRAGLQVLSLSIIDLSVAADSGLREVCKTPGDQESPVLDVSMAKFQDMNVSLNISRMSVLLSASMVRVVNELNHGLRLAMVEGKSRAQQAGVVLPTKSELLNSKWSLAWNVESLQFAVAEPWVYDGRVSLVASSNGHADESGNCVSKTTIKLDLDDELGHHTMVQECAWHVEHDEAKKVVVRCSALVSRFPLQKFISIWHFLRFHRGSFQSGSTSGPSNTSFEVRIDKAILQIHDRDRGECLASVNKLIYSGGSQGSAISVDGLHFDILSGSEMHGSLRVSEIATWWTGDPKFDFGIMAALEVLDSVGHVAIRCAVLRVTSSRQNAGLTDGPHRLRIRVLPHDVELDTSEAFVAECRRFGAYLSTLKDALGVGRFVFDSRPLGLDIAGFSITGVSGKAESLGIAVGSKIAAMEPAPDEADVGEHLAKCTLPVTLLLLAPPRLWELDVSIAQFSLLAIRFETKSTIGVVVEQADIMFEEFSEPQWRGTSDKLVARLGEFYSQALGNHLPALLTAASIGGSSVVSSALGVALGGGVGLMSVAARVARDTATAGDALGRGLVNGALAESLASALEGAATAGDVLGRGLVNGALARTESLACVLEGAATAGDALGRGLVNGALARTESLASALEGVRLSPQRRSRELLYMAGSEYGRGLVAGRLEHIDH